MHIIIDAAKNADYKVVIVGTGPIESKLKEQAKKQGVDNIVFFGYLKDEDKVALLSLCRSVVFRLI